jgi:hypothetical protein
MHSVLQRELVKARLHNRVVRAHGVASPYPGLVPSVLGPLATVSTPSAEEDDQVLSRSFCEFLSFGWFVGSEKASPLFHNIVSDGVEIASLPHERRHCFDSAWVIAW